MPRSIWERRYMKRIVILGALLALVAGGLHVVPAAAAAEGDPTVVPDVVQIEDPLNDANFLNDQDQAPNGQGDIVTPADAGSVSDLLKVWFTNTAEEVSAHILVERVPPASTTLLYRIYTSPGEGPEGKNSKGCLRFLAIIGGKTQGQDTSTYRGADYGALDDICNGTDEVVGKLTLEASGDNGIITITGPRSASPLLKDGLSLTQPYAVSKLVAGAEGQTYLSSATADNTKIGTDYALQESDASTPPPGKNPTPGKKKGCDKGKGKKKGCAKTPKTKACAPLAPATAGADAPAVTLTDENTADKPLVQKVTMERKFDEGLAGDAKPTSVNVQVDTNLKEVGLYATLEFPARRDYDLWAYFPGSDNKEAASSHGFNPLIDTKGLPGPADQSNTASNRGGETTASSENLVGILTPDCGGYTVTGYTYLGEGGELDLKLWLGEVKYDPASDAEEGAVGRAYNSIMTLL
ncbi:MAG: hypothetical protein M3N53_11480 [Actinomycetota bacterium]|nr:hypothetical protein [Actinomycetota bacterium]